MRWRHGERLIPPSEFIPLAEESGLIVPLSHWALAQAAGQVACWRRDFVFDGTVAVNLPARLLERPDLVDRLRACTLAHQVPVNTLQIEITETSLMKDLKTVQSGLQRLSAVGVGLSIDDFGTGYSSLAYLTSLPITELKIDGSFIRQLGGQPQGTAVVTAIIALARSLGLEVVAECVESLHQMELLHRLGCSVMQGYLFSHPMPPDGVEAWLRDTVLPRRAPWIGAVARNAVEPALPGGADGRDQSAG
jgi:EAL domain-containing protein (putative c-di-GMP-specific phosphodiesterase class I)